MDWSSIIAGGAGVGFSSTIGLFLFKRWIHKVDDRLEKIEDRIIEHKVSQAEDRGKFDLVWREIKTDKQKIIKLQDSEKKIWESLSGLVSPRISDILNDSTDGDKK